MNRVAPNLDPDLVKVKQVHVSFANIAIALHKPYNILAVNGQLHYIHNLWTITLQRVLSPLLYYALLEEAMSGSGS